MQTKRSFFLLGVLALVFFSSCTIMKRHYTRGFYFGSKSSTKEPTAVAAKAKKDSKEKSIPELVTKAIASISHQGAPTPVVKHELLASTQKKVSYESAASIGCDTLFLKDGTVIAARVFEISPYQVRFRYCAGTDKTEKAIAKRDIDHITYANGTVERFDNVPQNQAYRSGRANLGVQQTNGFALAGFILSILVYPTLFIGIAVLVGVALGGTAGTGGVVLLLLAVLFWLLGLIFSIAGIAQIANDRAWYKGMGFAVAGLIISLLPFLLLVLSYLHI